MADETKSKENKSLELGDDDEIISYGGVVKSLDNGTITGQLIQFTTAKDPDLTGDYFSKESVIQIGAEMPVYYMHGRDSKIGKTRIGTASIKQDDVAIWAETQLNLRNEYEKAIAKMAAAGKLGYSSGSLPYLMDRKVIGDGKSLITNWVVGEVSLTPMPAEARNIVSVKSLSTLPGGVAEDGEQNQSKPIHKESKDMDENEVKSIVAQSVAAALEEQNKAQKAIADAKAAQEAHDADVRREAEKSLMESLTKKGALRPKYHTTEPVKESDDGMRAFKTWLVTGEVNHELIEPDSSFASIKDGATKTAYNVGAGASGAYLVPDPLYQTIQAKRDLASWARQLPTQQFTTPADHILVPVEGTKMTKFVRTNENAAYNENEATMSQIDLILYKYTKVVLMSEEFMNYEGTNFDSWLSMRLGGAVAITENTLFSYGTGTADVQGVKVGATAGNSAATTQTLVPADLAAWMGLLGGGYHVQGQTGFLMPNATKWYLKGQNIAGFFAFQPTPAVGPAAQNWQGAIGDAGFFGEPCAICDDYSAYTVTGITNVTGTYGNWNYYGIVEKPGMLIQRNPYLYMNTGQIGLFCNIFRGGAVLQSEAFYNMLAHA